jgi:hypothetical protein
MQRLAPEGSGAGNKIDERRGLRLWLMLQGLIDVILNFSEILPNTIIMIKTRKMYKKDDMFPSK